MRGRPGAGTGGLPPPAGRPTSGRWLVQRWSGRAGEFHGRDWPDAVMPTAWLFRVTRPALVLGSTQPAASVDAERATAAGVDVVRRHSGGGAVFLVPGEVVWLDVLVPAADALWESDVGRAFLWLGEAWVSALSSVGVAARCHEGPLMANPWSRLICFAGVGPGEVMVGERKVVGMSQRRTRAGALFQCAALISWDPRVLVDLLALSGADRRRAGDELAGVAAGLDVDPSRLEDAIVTQLADL